MEYIVVELYTGTVSTIYLSYGIYVNICVAFFYIDSSRIIYRFSFINVIVLSARYLILKGHMLSEEYTLNFILDLIILSIVQENQVTT